MTTRIILLIFSLISSEVICAQALPVALSSLVDQNAQDGAILLIDKLNSEQRKFYWQNTTKNANGYLEIVSPLDYLNIVDDIATQAVVLRDVNILKEFKLTTNGLDRTHSISLFKESEGRINFIYKTHNEPTQALTIWNFRKAGAKITLIKDFFNCKVNGKDAILSLSKNNSSKKAIWKLSWWTKDSSYEFYLKDKLLANGQPTRSVAEVRSIASSLVIGENTGQLR